MSNHSNMNCIYGVGTLGARAILKSAHACGLSHKALSQNHLYFTSAAIGPEVLP